VKYSALPRVALTPLAIALGLLSLAGSPLFAGTTYVYLSDRPPGQNSEIYNGVSYDISPYSGSIGSNATGGAPDQAAKLFCDDFIDNAVYGTGWAVNVTTVSSSNLSNTRFGSANANSIYGTGTVLYQQLAWLFTQSMQTNQTIANQDAIQEAVWYMTGNGATPKATATATGSNKTYLQWITAAQSNYNTNAYGYLTPDYSNWLIVTDVNAKGYTSGHGNQEFLAYYSANGVPHLSTPTPEPATSALIGLGLLAAGLLKRRSRNAR
jgi:hypothetical protein